jgi:hypothetical protein
MGVNDRRFFACPALIPHVLEKTLFAGTFVPSIPGWAGSIPRENSAWSRQSRFFAVRYELPQPDLGCPRWRQCEACRPGRSGRGAGPSRAAPLVPSRRCYHTCGRAMTDAGRMRVLMLVNLFAVFNERDGGVEHHPALRT